MNTYVSYLIALLFGFFLLTACQSEGQTNESAQESGSVAAAPAGTIKLLGPGAFQAYLESHPDAQLVDVRTPRECNNGIIEGAMMINIASPDYATKIQELDRDKPILVYCAVGGRSGRAARQLQAWGFKEVYDLQGGISAWNSKSMKLVQP